ncbi:MAG: hypothetical protein WC823_06425 [Parcubacteria group bacterium]|jgi:hypothetical protein
MKKVALLLFGTILSLGMPALTFAEEGNMPASENQFEIIADVNIRDSHIIKQENNNITVGFTLSNGKGAQSDIRYSARLVKQNPDKSRINAYQQVYADKVTLAENSKINKEALIEAPAYLDGAYEVWLFSQNGDGLPLSNSMVGNINLKSVSVQYIDIKESTCRLSIKGLEKNYSLRQGVDVAANEELILSCEAESLFEKAVTAKVSAETFKRSLYGDQVTAAGEPQSIIFNPREKKKIDIVIPKAKDPQAYDIAVTLTENKNISNTVTAHYVVQGDSATISNLQLDKSIYAKGDKSVTSFIWSLSADSFSGSRSDKKDNKTVYYNLLIQDGNRKDCINPVKHALLTRDSVTTKAIADIIQDCTQPTVALAIEDENGKVLVKKDYNFTPSSPTDGIVTQSTFNGESGVNTKNIVWIVIGIVTLMALMAIVGYGIKNRSIKLFIFLILSGSILLTHNAGASTLANLNFRGTDSVYCDYTAPDKVVSGSNFQVTSSGCVVDICGNTVDINFYLGGSSVSGNISSTYDYGSAWISAHSDDADYFETGAPTARTLTAPTTVGAYNVGMKYDFDHLTGIGVFSEESCSLCCSYNNNRWSCSPLKNNAGDVSVLNPERKSISCGANSGRTDCAWARITKKGSFAYDVINNTCQGAIPVGGGYVAYDAEENTSLANNTTNWTYASSDTRTKCEYKCATGYYRNGEVCSPIVNGVCGLANDSSSASVPTVNLCSTGTASAVTTNVSAGKYNWQCIGSGGSTADCSANIYVAAGTCNQAVAKTNPAYPVSDSNWPTITCPGTGVYIPPTGRTRRWIPARQCPVKFCSTGTEPIPAPIFPAAAGGTVSWTCTGINSPTNATCTAKKNYYECTPLTPSFPHASMCTADNSEVINSADVAWKLKDYSGCTDRKCEYACSVGYRLESGVCNCQVTNCAQNTCIGKTCKDCVGNDLTDVPGTKDCRDLNWREVAPN